MGRNAQRMAVVRSAAMLLALSLGLSGCETCRNLGGRIFGSKKPAVPEQTAPAPPVQVSPTPMPTPTPEKPAGPERPVTAPTPEEALQAVYFDYDSSVLRDDTRKTLDKNLEWLKANGAVRVQLEGHCDERGTEEYNLHLGERRANSVKQYLIKNGIEQSRLFTISYGKDRPIDPGHNEAAWARNRRVQFSRY